MTELALRNWMLSQNLTVKEGTLENRLFILEMVLKKVFEPRTCSDRTCFRNVIKWLEQKCRSGRFEPDELFKRVIDYALEASNPQVRKPPAVFMYILKNELGYKNGERNFSNEQRQAVFN